MDKFDANKLIQERAVSRGSFVDVSIAAQGFKAISKIQKASLRGFEREALDNIFSKIARIVCRKSAYDLDSWQDIAGYATLVVNLIKQEASNEAE